ncbi:putative nucleic acid-binding Zn-ribbon protein [Herbaspirillum sp. Sphag1AN]|uniref:hypothetical protein n=1 Tax=unclassified Herbaspirillum TaxID=2624150 RepID=UPI00161E68C4|nr:MULTISPECIES: hypothetical protein [unclassified Herbaspirillum]MBB3212088.1 putative nucleic acid-binding Zn-ribbon protein [Herbaspirillum sp. Sphag1AN]MBB3244078.1 putative nucleic acid-binding Zn-ribbon protein [Herbaspirillum sp. Sphag64]
MNQKTLRTQNKCGECGYTWFPRGKDLSLVCPKCKSSKVGFVRSGVIGAAIIFGILFFVVAHNHSPNAVADTATPASIRAEEGSSHSDQIEKQPQLSPSSESTPVFSPPSSASSPSTEATARETQPEKMSESMSDRLQFPEMKIFSDQEISQMEDAKQYHGDDPIIRKRLGLPSRETRQLLP